MVQYVLQSEKYGKSQSVEWCSNYVSNTNFLTHGLSHFMASAAPVTWGGDSISYVMLLDKRLHLSCSVFA